MTTVSTKERLDYFRSVVDDVFSPMQIIPDWQRGSSFEAELEVTALGRLRLARVATSPLSVKRREAEVARLTDTPYLVKFQLSGESLWRQRGQEVHLQPGDFVIASLAEPYELVLPGEYQMPVLAIDPITMRSLTPDPNRFLGLKMSGEDADCGLLSSFVGQVAHRMARLREPMISRVEANILDLLGGVLAARTGTGALNSEQQRTRIRTYIEHHLHDRELNPSKIAHVFTMSTRSLHALFEDQPASVGRYIKACRLEAARKALIDPARRAGRSLTDIALDVGFYDLSHMTRSFREHFGTSPRDYLAGATQ